MIHLKPITVDNWEAAVALRVRPDQETFVASNLRSIAESQFVFGREDGLALKPTPLAIYDDAVMVGFAMYLTEQQHGEFFIINRIMIAADQQGHGYGRAAMQQLLARIEAEAGPNASQIMLSYEPENETARKLYASLGFVETGDVVGGGELRAMRPITPRSA